MENLNEDLLACLPTGTLDTSFDAAGDGEGTLFEVDEGAVVTVEADQGENRKRGQKRSKEDRKIARKSSRMKQLIEKQIGVSLSEEPNQWLLVWGIGIANGISKRRIYNYLTPTPAEVRLYVDQTYTFVRSRNVDDAKELKERHQGARFNKTQTLYVEYVDKSAVVPSENNSILRPFRSECPEGLIIRPNYISLDQEILITKALYVGPTTGQRLKKRTVHHFGYEFRYGTNDVDDCAPLPNKIPDYLALIVEDLVEMEVFSGPPDQLTVNQYLAGQGIPPHCDTHSCFEGPIVAISLGADVVMDFRQGDKMYSVIVPGKSLMIMDGPSRFGWTHGITPRKYDWVPDGAGITVMPRDLRLSLTFRKLRRGPKVCNCDFPNLCDSQKGKITRENASSLENDLVHSVYEEIAEHFTETRHKPWPKVKEFVETLKPGDRFLDVGCANGKYFGINKDILEIGIDMSRGLLRRCYAKGFDVARANGLFLPFPDNYFDGAISIAVLHHIATKERRLKCLQEILRVMTPGGRGLIYVWAKEQTKDDTQSMWSERQGERTKFGIDVCTQKSNEYSFLPVHDRDQEFPINDMLVPWTSNQENSSTVHHRYYHVFSEGELETLVSEMSPAPQIIKTDYDQGNWVVMIQK